MQPCRAVSRNNVMQQTASQRAFAKAGFRIDRGFDDVPSGRCVLMVRRRQDAPVS